MNITARLAAVAAAASLFATLQAQAPPEQHAGAVLVELFTSEGCSSCPPADDLLRRVSGQTTHSGQLVVTLSEHVSYWNNLGWKDPFSSDQYTARQNNYAGHFGLDSVYTPQMVVNGRTQLVGGNQQSLEQAINAEGSRPHIDLHLTSAAVADGHVSFTYTAAGLPAKGSYDLFAALTDDEAQSNVLWGENSGRRLVHVSVTRALANVGRLKSTAGQTINLPLPASFAQHPVGHHLVLFAQQTGAGAIIGIDTRSL